MRKVALLLLAAGGATLLALFVARIAPSSSHASSHREAPLISEDPSADNTDLYAFRSPDKPSTFTIVSNWIPGEDPAAGPNWYTFSPSARYNIYIDTDGDVRPNYIYRFRFKTPTGPFFLGNTVQSFTATLNGKPLATKMRPVWPGATSRSCSSNSFTTVPSGGLPAVPGAARRSSGVAIVAHATSVEP